MKTMIVTPILDFLEVEPAAPSPELLNALVKQHQLRVPFETLTKLIDYEARYQSQDFMPDLETYILRVVQRGGGGACWTLARGFYWLLTALGFEAYFMIMQPGHVCLRVELDQPYYVDVGYCAPLFQAYPLFESFTVRSQREIFTYRVEEDAIYVDREPGPNKILDVRRKGFADFSDNIHAANQWHEDSFLVRLSYLKYIDDSPVWLNFGKLHRYEDNQLIETDELSENEICDTLRDVFHADPNLYREARRIRNKWMRHYNLTPKSDQTQI